MCVRLESIEALTRLSVQNAGLAATALDFLVDMFNDEIELVRLKAIDSLTRIANRISLQMHQLETILSALDDFSMVVREKLHLMLQASTIATKDGLQNVIQKLLENLKRYPQDKRSILVTFKSLGLKHADLTLPLVTQLLEIHPFFDTAEPDIEDPSYLCLLVLVFNAAHCSPTLGPLLDHHTKRHFDYLIHTYPNLAKKPTLKNVSITTLMTSTAAGTTYKPSSLLSSKTLENSNTIRFLQQILDRIRSSVHGAPTTLTLDGRIKNLHRAQSDLERLGSIEPAIADAAIFARIYIQTQNCILRCLSCRFWTNSTAMQTQQGEVVQNTIAELFRLCSQLQGRFVFTSGQGDSHMNGTAGVQSDVNESRLNKKQEEKKMQKGSHQQNRLLHALKLKAMALHLVFLIRRSNKSALTPTEHFLREVEKVSRMFPMESDDSAMVVGGKPRHFLHDLLHKLHELPSGAEGRKPGVVARVLQPLLIHNPVEALSIEDILGVSMCKAIVYEPVGNNETPLKYTAGLVLAVPVDCDLVIVKDTCRVKVAIKTPDQKVSLVTPKVNDFCPRQEAGAYRLLTNALMSHNVWSEALHVEISVVLDLNNNSMMGSSSAVGQGSTGGYKRGNSGSSAETKESNLKLVHLCEPIKVYVLPKNVKRSIL